MSRTKSAVLSPADKKAVVKNLKLQLKDATDALKAIAKNTALAQKTLDKTLSAAAKDSAKLEKAAAKLNADLLALAPALQAA